MKQHFHSQMNKSFPFFLLMVFFNLSLVYSQDYFDVSLVSNHNSNKNTKFYNGIKGTSENISLYAKTDENNSLLTELPVEKKAEITINKEDNYINLNIDPDFFHSLFIVDEKEMIVHMAKIESDQVYIPVDELAGDMYVVKLIGEDGTLLMKSFAKN